MILKTYETGRGEVDCFKYIGEDITLYLLIKDEIRTRVSGILFLWPRKTFGVKHQTYMDREDNN